MKNLVSHGKKHQKAEPLHCIVNDDGERVFYAVRVAVVNKCKGNLRLWFSDKYYKKLLEHWKVKVMMKIARK